jgi:hypothetical protein
MALNALLWSSAPHTRLEEWHERSFLPNFQKSLESVTLSAVAPWQVQKNNIHAAARDSRESLLD